MANDLVIRPVGGFDGPSLEIALEPLPHGPLVPRAPEPVEPRTGLEVVHTVDEEPAAPAAPTTEEPARLESTRRPVGVGHRTREPERRRPPRASRREMRRTRPFDRLHPVRATVGLVVLVVFGSGVLAAAIGIAFAVMALAVRRSLG